MGLIRDRLRIRSQDIVKLFTHTYRNTWDLEVLRLTLHFWLSLWMGLDVANPMNRSRIQTADTVGGGLGLGV